MSNNRKPNVNQLKLQRKHFLWLFNNPKVKLQVQLDLGINIVDGFLSIQLSALLLCYWFLLQYVFALVLKLWLPPAPKVTHFSFTSSSKENLLKQISQKKRVEFLELMHLICFVFVVYLSMYQWQMSRNTYTNMSLGLVMGQGQSHSKFLAKNWKLNFLLEIQNNSQGNGGRMEKTKSKCLLMLHSKVYILCTYTHNYNMNLL